MGKPVKQSLEATYVSLGEIEWLHTQDQKCYGDQEQVLRKGLLYHGHNLDTLFGV